MSTAVVERLERAIRHVPPDDRDCKGQVEGTLPELGQVLRRMPNSPSELAAKAKDGTLLKSPEIRLDSITAREMCAGTYSDALKIGQARWGEEEDCVADMEKVWLSYINGPRTFFSEYVNDEVTLVSSSVYYDPESEERVAIAGLYRTKKEPNTVWFDWFALDPDYVKSHADKYEKGMPSPTRQIMEHLCAVGKELGATWIKAWTPDEPGYALAHAFYERNVMRMLGLFDHAGEKERIYGKPLDDCGVIAPKA